MSLKYMYKTIFLYFVFVMKLYTLSKEGSHFSKQIITDNYILAQ